MFSFGGGPPCTHLYICPLCQSELDRLNQKRKTELDKFIAVSILKFANYVLMPFCSYITITVKNYNTTVILTVQGLYKS